MITAPRPRGSRRTANIDNANMNIMTMLIIMMIVIMVAIMIMMIIIMIFIVIIRRNNCAAPPRKQGELPRRGLRSLARNRCHGTLFRDFKDTVYPFFESDTLFLECVFGLLFVF